MKIKHIITRSLLATAAVVIALTSSTGLVLAQPTIYSQSPGTMKPTVVGGENSSQPWAVSIQTLGILGFNHECGGTLIAPQWIMTAAHCTDYINTILSYARIGSVSKSSGGERIKIAQVVPYPDFPKADGSFGNDIALLKLARPSTKTTFPLSLAGGENTTGFAAGWGTTCDSDLNNPLCSAALPDKLKQVNLRRVEDTECRLIDPKTGNNINDIDTMDCYVAASGGREGICFGDSGSPLLQQRGNDWAVVGVVNADMDSTTIHENQCSTAPGGGTNHQATTDVWPFVSWIQATIDANSSTAAERDANKINTL